jgi:hypothetical protein
MDSCTRPTAHAGVAELVDALVLGTSIARCGGSSPFARTNSPEREPEYRTKKGEIIEKVSVLFPCRLRKQLIRA